jgi:hypothetical protein
MSGEIYYNRRDWTVSVLSQEILETLDERYVNTDEVISTREIEMLYVKYITMIDPIGYIQYADGSRQYTAANDNLDKDNIYSGRRRTPSFFIPKFYPFFYKPIFFRRQSRQPRHRRHSQ